MHAPATVSSIDARPGAGRRPAGPSARALAATWLVVALAAVLQGAVAAHLEGRTVELVWLLRWRLAPVALWAAATPGLFLLARRWPVGRGRTLAHLCLHALAAGGWILVSNVLLRLPEVAAGPAAALHDALSGAVAYGPGALALYALIVAIGQRAAGADGEEADEEAEAKGEAAVPRPSSAPDPFRGRLPVREGDRIRLLPPAEIRWIEADGDHVMVHGTARTWRVRGTLKRMQAELRGDGFLRVHRSAVVNLAHVREFQPYFHGDYVAVLDDGTVVRVPRSRREVVERLREAFVAAG